MAIAALTACVKTISPEVKNLENEQSKYVKFEIAPPRTINPYSGEEITTRSAKYDDLNFEFKSGCNIWVYDLTTKELVNNKPEEGLYTYFMAEEMKQVPCTYIFPWKEDVMMKPKRYLAFAIYNMDELPPPQTLEEAMNFKYKFKNYDSFKSNGFPMASKQNFLVKYSIDGYPYVSSSFTFVPLVSLYEVDFTPKDNPKFDIEKVTVHNAARVILPFKPQTSFKAESEDDVLSEDDYMTVEEMKANKGYLYMLENRQGEIFNDELYRIEKNIKSELKGKCFPTYIEVKLKEPLSNGKPNVKKYFCGAGKTAEVERNTLVHLYYEKNKEPGISITEDKLNVLYVTEKKFKDLSKYDMDFPKEIIRNYFNGGEEQRIKMEVTPKYHTAITVAKISDPTMADIKINNDTDELSVIPKKLGRLTVTLTLDGKEFNFDINIIQELSFYISEKGYMCFSDFVQGGDIKGLIQCFVEGSVTVTNLDQTLTTYTDFKAVKTLFTIRDVDTYNFLHFPDSDINYYVKEMESRGYESYDSEYPVKDENGNPVYRKDYVTMAAGPTCINVSIVLPDHVYLKYDYAKSSSSPYRIRNFNIVSSERLNYLWNLSQWDDDGEDDRE